MPGPPWVPMTGPSVVTMSSDAAGRAAPEALDELRRVIGRVRMADADVQVGGVLRRLQEHRLELGQRLRAAADALERRHLAVVEVQDRLHVEELAGEPRRLADAAAADEVLQRLDREEEAARASEALDDRQRAPRRSCPARAGAGARRRGSTAPPQMTPESTRRHPVLPDDSAASLALSNVPESFAESRSEDDPLVAGELLVGGGEVGRRRLGASSAAPAMSCSRA